MLQWCFPCLRSGFKVAFPQPLGDTCSRSHRGSALGQLASPFRFLFGSPVFASASSFLGHFGLGCCLLRSRGLLFASLQASPLIFTVCCGACGAPAHRVLCRSSLSARSSGGLVSCSVSPVQLRPLMQCSLALYLLRAPLRSCCHRPALLVSAPGLDQIGIGLLRVLPVRAVQ